MTTQNIYFDIGCHDLIESNVLEGPVIYLPEPAFGSTNS